jgi:beta-carotene ketolase (CrtW type)
LNICARSLLYAVEFEQVTPKQDTLYGLIIALLIISIWAASLALLLSLDTAKFPTWLIPIAVV